MIIIIIMIIVTIEGATGTTVHSLLHSQRPHSLTMSQVITMMITIVMIVMMNVMNITIMKIMMFMTMMVIIQASIALVGQTPGEAKFSFLLGESSTIFYMINMEIKDNVNQGNLFQLKHISNSKFI